MSSTEHPGPGGGSPAHVLDAKRNPGDYFTCICGDGPWHKTWTSPLAWDRYKAGSIKLLGGCCSGAD